MSTSREKKQKRILYFCFVILVITAAIAAAVTGAYKKSEKSRTPEATGTAETQTAAPSEDAAADGKETDDGKGETDKKEAGIIPARPTPEAEESKTEPVSLTPEPITFVAPVSGSVYADFSDAVPVFSNTMNDYRTHAGVDVSAGIGDPVLACADGVIDEVWEDPMMGQSVRITHADGFESVYRNLSAVLPAGIEKGAAVRAGQTIGAVGDTALIECEDEPHLHFELLLAGTPVDPSLHVVFSPAGSDYEG